MRVFWLGMDPLQRTEYWDCTILCDLFDGLIWTPAGFPEFEHTTDPDDIEPGTVFVIPGAQCKDDIGNIDTLIDRGRPGIVCIVKDEGSVFPWRKLNLDHFALWVQNPRPDRHDGSERGLPVGWTPKTRALAAIHSPVDKVGDWFFAGQVTHARRKKCVAQLERMPNGKLLKTRGFLQGMPPIEYLAHLAACKVAPCPGGVITPDSFRVWEALELGCIPLADTLGGRGDGLGYWQHLLRGKPPFPLIEDWAEAPRLIAAHVDAWPGSANRVQSWWHGWKRRMAHQFHDDLRAAAPDSAKTSRPGDRLTVLMPTSSIPSHPSTDIIEETLMSIRSRPELDGCEIIVMVDGLREQHEDRRADYELYVAKLLTMSRGISNCYIMVFDRPEHQSGMTKEALKHVRTPAILYVEHDTPLVGEVPWENLIDAVQCEADVVRLHHEASVLDVHMHLMPDGRAAKDVAGVPMVRTYQWSQRPHVANTGFYRQIMADHFSLSRERVFIEDRMHSICEVAWRQHGEAGWTRYRLWMYHPGDGMSIKRSTHLDGRAGEAKVG